MPSVPARGRRFLFYFLVLKPRAGLGGWIFTDQAGDELPVRKSRAALLSWLGEEDSNPRYQGQNLASYP